jgi:hypothetical protein
VLFARARLIRALDGSLTLNVIRPAQPTELKASSQSTLESHSPLLIGIDLLYLFVNQREYPLAEF